MSLEYFSTLVGISVEVLAFVIAFYGAYLVYLRQQRDKYREELIKDFQGLDKTVSQWSFLEDRTHPLRWHPPTSKYIQILTKETWEKSPLEKLKGSLKELDKIYNETQKKEMEERNRAKGRLTAGPALYLKVKFALHDLIQIIYREFPPTPGDYEVSPPPGQIPIYVESYVKYDFPNNRESFLTWADRYDLFFKGLYEVYYRIRSIIDTLKKVHLESVEQTEKWIVELEKMDRFDQRSKDQLREIQQYSVAEVNFYEEVFQLLGKMKHETDRIRGKINTYENYFFKGKWKMAFSLIAMVLTGILIPFTALLFQPDWPLQTVKLLSTVGFGLSTISTVLLVYFDISKF